MTSIRSLGQLRDLALPAHPEAPLPSPIGHMKVSSARIKTIEGATAAALDTAVNAFVITLTEERFLGAQFGKPDGGNYWAVIVYVE